MRNRSEKRGQAAHPSAAARPEDIRAAVVLVGLSLATWYLATRLWPGMAGWRRSDESSRVIFHMLLPAVATAGFIGLFSRSTLGFGPKRVVPGLALLWMAVLDLVWSFSSARVIPCTDDSIASLLDATWLVGHGVMAGALALAYHERFGAIDRDVRHPALTACGVAIIAGLLGLVLGLAPRLIWSGPAIGPIGRPLAWLVVPVFIHVAFRAARRWREDYDSIDLALVTTCVLAATAQVLYAFGNDAADGATFLAHTVKMGAYVAPLVAITYEDARHVRTRIPARIRLTLMGTAIALLLGCAALIGFMAEKGRDVLEVDDIAQLKEAIANVDFEAHRPLRYLTAEAFRFDADRSRGWTAADVAAWKRDLRRYLITVTRHESAQHREQLDRAAQALVAKTEALRARIGSLDEHAAREALFRYQQAALGPMEHEVGLASTRLQSRLIQRQKEARRRLVAAVCCTVGIVMFLAIGAMILTHITTSNFVRSVRNLSVATRALANGDTTVRLAVEGHDEMAGLGLAFNAMSERLALKTRELQILAKVMDGTDEPVVVFNPDGRIAYVNRAFTEVTGWQTLQAIGRPYDFLLAGPLASRQTADLAESVSNNTHWMEEAVLRTPKGRGIEALVSVSPVVEEDEVTHFVAIHRDISRLRRLERERDAFNRNLLKLHGVGRRLMESLDVEEICERCIDEVRQRFGVDARVWVIRPGDVCDDCPHSLRCRDMSRCLHCVGGRPDDGCGRTPEDDAFLGRVVLGDEHLAVDDNAREWHAAFRLDGKEAPLGVLEVTIGDTDHGKLHDTMHLLAQILAAAISNATLHRQATEQTRQLEQVKLELERTVEEKAAWGRTLKAMNDQLRDADRMKTQFLATTSHELRTPLSGVLGLLELVLDGLAESPEEEKDFIREAHECAQHLLGIINDVLDVARIEAGRLKMRYDRVDLLPLFNDVRTVTQVSAQKRGIELRFEADEDLAVYADFERAKQVLINLVGNALKFTDEGSVTVAARGRPEVGIVEFRVTDTGVGIAPDQIDQIFEAFVQADAGDSRRFGGSGLGLTITRNLLSMMGGTVRIDSEGEGHGTTVTFTLPIYRVKAYRPPKRTNSTARETVESSVVFVDPDVEFAARFEDAAEERGMRVFKAASAEECLELIRTHPIDTVVTAYALRHRSAAVVANGIDLVDAIAAAPDLRQVQVFMTHTGSLHEHPIVRELRQRPGLTVFEKPVDPAELIQHMVEPDTWPDASTGTGRILVVDSQPATEMLVRRALFGGPFEVEFRTTADAAVEAIESHPDVLIAGLAVPEIASILKRALSPLTGAPTRVVVVGGDAVPDDVVESLLRHPAVAGTIDRRRLARDPRILRRLIRRLARTASETPVLSES